MIKRFRARPLPPKIIMLGVALIVVGIGGWIYYNAKQKGGPDVQNFDACVAAGNPVLETYPEQCTHNGRSFFKPGQAPYDPKDDLIQ